MSRHDYRRLALLLALSALVALPLVCWHRKPSPVLSGDLDAIPALLDGQGVRLHATWDNSGSLYLTTQPRDVDELRQLLPRPQDVERWQGVVHVWRLPPPEGRRNEWGDRGFQAGNLAVYGDPVLVARIKAALR